MSSYLTIAVTARAKKTAIGPVKDSPLRVWVSAPAVDGKANGAVLKLLAEKLAIPPSCLSIVRGAGARRKKIFVECLDESELMGRLAAAGREKSDGKNI
ncbi:MAG: DUF167 domain-containing protein [Puniceicoccales bacterium]|nr:DUF167 domain-containing protein [Puniceicoccales bacterium]